MQNVIKKKTALPDIPVVIAKRCYDTASEAYESGNFKIAYNKLKEAVSINPLNVVYKNRLTLMENEIQNVQGMADKFLDEARESYANKDYDRALLEINEALEIVVMDEEAKKLKLKIERAIQKKNKREQKRLKDAEQFFKSGSQALDKLDFKGAEEAFFEALKLFPENENYKEFFEIAKGGKIKLSKCSKKMIMSLDGFDEDKANAFIAARKAGRVWYDMESFAKDFELQPHQEIINKEQIEFMLKPKPVKGRRLDF